MYVTCKIPGKPVGKGRPRVMSTGHAYTPERTVLYENLIKVEYERQCNHRFDDNAPLTMTITVDYAPPRAATKKMREDMLKGRLQPTKKPDIDNIVKVIADALNGVAYHDDVQITELYVKKSYAEEDSVTFTLCD